MALDSIFISHSSQDNDWCRIFVNVLHRAGLDVWYDERDLHHGPLWDILEDELQQRPIFIVILSPDSISSTWVRREFHAAVSLQEDEPDRIILPVMARQVSLPLFWREYAYIAGPGGVGLAAEETARLVIQRLGLTPMVSETSQSNSDSAKVQELWEHGKMLRAQGRAQEALIVYEAVVALAPERPSYWHAMGLALQDLDRDEDALSAFDHALTLNRRYARAWFSRGMSQAKLKRFEDATTAFEQGLRIAPEDITGWVNSGNALIMQHQYERAIEDYERALALDSRLPEALNGKGLALRRLGRVEEALAAFDEAIRWYPRYVTAWTNKIVTLETMGRTDDAKVARQQRDTALGQKE